MPPSPPQPPVLSPKTPWKESFPHPLPQSPLRPWKPGGRVSPPTRRGGKWGPWETPVRMSTWLHQRTRYLDLGVPRIFSFRFILRGDLYLFRQIGPGPLLTSYCTEASCPVEHAAVTGRLPNRTSECPFPGGMTSSYLQFLSL